MRIQIAKFQSHLWHNYLDIAISEKKQGAAEFIYKWLNSKYFIQSLFEGDFIWYTSCLVQFIVP